MSKVMLFAAKYPVKHPKAGQPTHFYQKVLTSLGAEFVEHEASQIAVYTDNLRGMGNLPVEEITAYGKKGHTIRGGKRWKQGGYFSARQWTGKPYCSKQLKITEHPVLIKKVYDIQVWFATSDGFRIPHVVINGETFYDIGRLAHNDGLLLNDFIAWFDDKIEPQSAVFDGQIICWDDTIVY